MDAVKKTAEPPLWLATAPPVAKHSQIVFVILIAV
jgi:hypothetical protein